MKQLLLIALVWPFAFSDQAYSQALCFTDPNTGPIYHNGALDGIYDVATGDFNNDGHQDIVTSNATGNSISFIAGGGNGSLAAPDTVAVPGALFAMCTIDYNNDSNLDLALSSNGSVLLMQGLGNGQFMIGNSYPAGFLPSRIYAHDINNDGRKDLLECGENGIYILIDQGAGVFSAMPPYLTNYSVNDMVVRDFDGDNIKDVVSTTRTSLTTAVLSFLKGNGNGTFSIAASYPVSHYSVFGICSEDFDKDGNFDLAVSNSNVNIKRLEVYKGNGDGTFQSPVYYPSPIRPTYLYTADINKDNSIDIIAVESSGFAVFPGQQTGTFSPYQYFTAVPSPNSLAIGDYNEDTKLDVIVPSAYFQSGLISVNLNCITLGMHSPSAVDNLLIYPNPSTAKVCISNTEPGAEVEVVTLTGLTVIRSSCNNSVTSIDMQKLPSGSYFLVYRHKGTRLCNKLLKF